MAGAYYNEIDPYAAQWLRNLIAAGHIAPGVVDERDVRDVEPDDLRGFTQCHFFAGIGGWSLALRMAGWPDDRPVWTGSCPCQPFSSAGKGAGFADERHLWPAWHHLVGQCLPPVVFGEQVEGKAGKAWFDLVQADLEGIGYACGAVIIPAAGVGAPHIRHRLWFAADRDGGSRGQGGALTLWGNSGGDAQQRAGLGSGSGAGGLADDDGERAWGPVTYKTRPENQRPQFFGKLSLAIGSSGEFGDAGVALGDGERKGLEERPEPEVKQRPLRLQGATLGEAEPLCGFWAGADWLWCRDGKYRPVEPRTFPLAHGIPARMGKLRAYGNAIVPQVAAQVIGAYLGELYR